MILISPPAERPGSYGDEAVMLGILGFARSQGIRVMIYEHRASYWASCFGLGGARRAGLRGLRAHAALSRLFGRGLARDVLVPGTDSLDGTYSPRRQLDRIALAQAVADRGGRVSFVGFSWERSDPDIIEALRQVLNARFILRDEASLERFMLDTGLGERATLGADLAYLVGASGTAPLDLVRRVRHWRDEGLAVVTVTPNGLWTRSDEGRLAALSAAITELSDTAAFVLVPHDARRGQSDLAAARSVEALLPAMAVRKRVSIFPARGYVEARAAIRLADVHIAGRMHSAISAWSQHRPALVFGYQHKALGQAEGVGQSDALIAPDSPPELLADRVLVMLREVGVREARIAAAVKGLRARASVGIEDVVDRSEPLLRRGR